MKNQCCGPRQLSTSDTSNALSQVLTEHMKLHENNVAKRCPSVCAGHSVYLHIAP